MLNEFLAWYARQMLDLLPASIRYHNDQPVHALIVETLPSEPGGTPAVQLTLRRNRRENSLGPFVLDPSGIDALRTLLGRRKSHGPARLRLHPGAMLEREVVLPLAAERDPKQVLDYEMDRNTPFRSAEVFWTWTPERRDPSRGRLHVRLSVVPKGEFLPTLTALEQAGIVVTQLEAPRTQASARLIDLPRADSARQRWLRHAQMTAAIVCALLAIAAVALPFVLQRAERDAVEQQLARLQPRVAQAEALRRQIQAKTAGTDVFSAERARVGDVLEILAAVTDILPDDTYLTDLTLREGRLSIEGRSAAAARLIGALSADPVIRNPAFSAPVTRMDGGIDQFSLRAEIAR